MKGLKSIAISCLLSMTSVEAAGKTPYSYIANGADWPLMKDEGNQCSGTNQSPIDLRTDANKAPFGNTDTAKEATWGYTNFDGAKITNLGKTIQIDLPEAATKENGFKTTHVGDKRGGHDSFTALQFHFHAKSEHTIDGKRYDMEMHIVHKADEAKGDPTTIAYSALGFMFDVDDYDETVTGAEMGKINAFFDSLGFDNMPPIDGAEGHKISENASVPLADLVSVQSDAGRWVYTGSLTTPPCSIGVYFQVFDRVLPISRKHLNMYLAQQKEYLQDLVYVDSGDSPTHQSQTLSTKVPLDKTGNWRVTNPIDNHNVYYLRANEPSKAKADAEANAMVMGILFAVGVVLSIALGITAFMMHRKIGQAGGDAGKTSINEGGEKEAGSATNVEIQLSPL